MWRGVLGRSVPLITRPCLPSCWRKFMPRNILWQIFLRLPPGRQLATAPPRSLGSFSGKGLNQSESAFACTANQRLRSQTDLIGPECALYKRGWQLRGLDLYSTLTQEHINAQSGQKISTRHAAYISPPRTGVGRGSFLQVLSDLPSCSSIDYDDAEDCVQL